MPWPHMEWPSRSATIDKTNKKGRAARAGAWKGRPDGRGRPREKQGRLTGALAFPGGVWERRWGERHSHYKQRGAEPRYGEKGPALTGAGPRRRRRARWMERGDSSNHRATIPILTREFGSEPPSGVPSGLQEKAPLSAGLELARGWRSLLARPSEAVAASGIDVGDAFIAAFHRTWRCVPGEVALACLGICLRGRRTRARGIGRGSARGLTGRSTGDSTGTLRSAVRLRGVRCCRRTWRRRRAILCVRPRHPSGRSQDAHSCDCDKSAFHRFLRLLVAEINAA